MGGRMRGTCSEARNGAGGLNIMVMLKNAGRLLAAVVLSGAGLPMVSGSARAGDPLPAMAGRMDPEASRRYARTWLGNSLVCVGRLAHAVIQTPSGQVTVRERFEEVASRLFEADWKIAAGAVTGVCA